MTSQAKEKQDEYESVPLLPKPTHEDKPSFSIVRARITSAFIPVFTLSAGSARDSMLAQFLVARLKDDAGFSNSSQIGSCIEDSNNSMIKIANEFQAEASEQLMYYSLVLTIPAFFTCLLAGSYTDYIGRRLLILIPTFTYFLRTAIICCVIKFHLDLRFIYLAYGIDGLVGSWYLLLLALFSFTADISFSKKDRTFWIYFVACSLSIMAAVINIAVGYLIKIYGFFEATLFLCSMMFVAFIVPLIFLPETLQHRRSIVGVSPLIHARKIIGFYFFDGPVRQRATFCVCLTLFVIGVANDLNVGSLDALYQMHQPFCWDSVQIGDYSAIRTAGGHFFGLILFKVLQMCVSIERIGMFGALFQGGAFILEAFIQVPWQFYLVPVILIPSCPIVSIIRTMLSMLAGPDNQGAVFSSIAVVETLCNLVSSQIFNRIYSATVAFMPGAVYLVMASFGFLTSLLFGIYFLVHERSHTYEVVVKKEEGNESIQNSITF
uniref:Major facilitator superfamily (MFS) profile domain-containing protein n=1 Tax=Arion vulgaris TaxID=1028688 RepID=A0A0B7A3W8_9EUPU